MDSLTDLKAILHSKRANIFYLEKCRVMQKDGRVLYLTEASNENQYWNIPIANTTVLLLGTGTSITQAAMRMLASAAVLVGFCGGGGTPLLMANEIEWLTPQSEYRPTALRTKKIRICDRKMIIFGNRFLDVDEKPEQPSKKYYNPIIKILFNGFILLKNPNQRPINKFKEYRFVDLGPRLAVVR